MLDYQPRKSKAVEEKKITDDDQMLRRGLVLDLAVAFGTYRDALSWIKRDMSNKRRTVDESDMVRVRARNMAD